MKRNFKFRDSVYLGESLKGKNLKKIERKICRFPLLSNYYFLTEATNGYDQLDIYSCRQLFNLSRKLDSPLILGIASDYDEACELLIEMAGECMAAGKEGNLREFFECGL